MSGLMVVHQNKYKRYQALTSLPCSWAWVIVGGTKKRIILAKREKSREGMLGEQTWKEPVHLSMMIPVPAQTLSPHPPSPLISQIPLAHLLRGRRCISKVSSSTGDHCHWPRVQDLLLCESGSDCLCVGGCLCVCVSVGGAHLSLSACIGVCPYLHLSPLLDNLGGVCVYTCVCMCVYMCVWCVCVRGCVGACVCVHVHACVRGRACVRACGRACV